MKRAIIIDSSVVAKWFFTDEPYQECAITIKHEFTLRRLAAAVPFLIFYEVNNLLKTNVKTKRITQEKAQKVYKAFTNLEFSVFSSKELLQQSLKAAIDLDISSYDASYIVLAESLKIPFYTADEKLVKKAAGDYVFHLKEYNTSTE